MSVQPRESAEKPGTRTTDQHQKPKSDIEISQAATMRPIVEVAAEKLDIPADYVLPYGHYKAKISLDYIASLGGRRIVKKKNVKEIQPPRRRRQARARPRPPSGLATPSIISARRRSSACASRALAPASA